MEHIDHSTFHSCVVVVTDALLLYRIVMEIDDGRIRLSPGIHIVSLYKWTPEFIPSEPWF